MQVVFNITFFELALYFTSAGIWWVFLWWLHKIDCWESIAGKRCHGGKNN